jgi:cell division transport system permease protein
VLVVALGLVLVLGGGIATAVLLVTGRLGPATHRYEVTVYLSHEVTAEQRAAIESALAGLHPIEGVRFESREQAYENFKRIFKDSPDLVDSVKPDTLPESYHLSTRGKEFDCAALAPVRSRPGIDEIMVMQVPDGKDRPAAQVHCP